MTTGITDVEWLDAKVCELSKKNFRLRSTLENRSVVLIGPKSPFWQCQYCQNAATSPLMFKHKSDCILSDDEDGSPLKSPVETP